MNNKFSYNKNSDKVIWIDLDNSPHVPFFAPIIKSLSELGYNIKISTRNYSQTVELADLFQFDYSPIGKHYGKNKIVKIIGLFYRAVQLLPFALKQKPNIAVSHGSRSQMIAAHFLKIPIVMFLDYEFIQTIPFVRPELIFLPHIISTKKFSGIKAKIITYPGIKEDIYVPEFKPDPSIMNYLRLKQNRINVVLRPPAHEAHYHNPESEKLFASIIKFLTNNSNVTTIILPRDNKQKLEIKNQYKVFFKDKKLIIPDEVIDGLNLIWHSDLVISGGGTMNREAAALGVPVYSIFRGKIGDVDKYLSDNGRLVLIENEKDISDKIRISKRIKSEFSDKLNSLALHTIVNEIINYLNSSGSINSTFNKLPYKNAKQLSKKRVRKQYSK
jgi:hypothetical protein